jgi:hypothetical protein
MSTVLDISTDGFPLRVHPWAADALLVGANPETADAVNHVLPMRCVWGEYNGRNIQFNLKFQKLPL